MFRTTGYFFLTFALLLGCAVAESEKPGFVEGHVNIGPLTPVAQEGAPHPTVSAEEYAALQLTVFKADGKTKVAQLMPDTKGNFRQMLAPGTYVVAMPVRKITRADLPKAITVVSDQTVHLDIEIETGIR